MSTRARMALMAAAATLMASCALLPLVESPGWLFQATLLLLAQTGVGVAARRVPLARWVTVGAQVLVSLVLLTLVFAREYALAGLIPGPQAFQHFADLLQAGTNDVERYAIPAPLSDGIELMLIGGVLVIGLLVDVVAVTFRSAAPAGLPLLALYSVAAGLSDGSGSWVWFLIAAAGYLMLLLAEGRDRLSQWGRVFAGGPRPPGGPAPEASGATAPVRTGRRIGVVALGIALVVPLGLPAMDGGLLENAGGGVGAGSGGGGTISAVNPLVSLRDSLNVDQDSTALTLRTDSQDLSDLYLRIVSLDEFDGTTWRPAKREIVEVPDRLPTPPGLAPDVARSEVTTRITAAEGYQQDWLPMPYPPSSVDVGGQWRYEPEGMTLVGDHGQDTGGISYEVTSLEMEPTAEQLAQAPEPPADLQRAYTQLPDSLPPVVEQTAREITLGAANAYEQAVRLQEYFALNGGFTYDTEVEVGSGSQAIAQFLEDKRGFCVHFSFAMASMARSLDIPARIAVGFAPGTMQADGSVAVGLRDAHAWPELYFEGVGWTRFEPTPSRGTTPSYTLPDVPGAAVPEPLDPARPSQAAPSQEPSSSPTCAVAGQSPESCESVAPSAAGGSADGGAPWYPVFGWTLLGLAVVAVPLAPMFWRIRRRAVRLASAQHVPSAAGGPGPGIRLDAPPGGPAATGHVLAVWEELTDTAWDYGIVPDDALTPRKAAARIVRLGRLDQADEAKQADDAASASVHRVAGAVEQVLFAPDPQAPPGLADDVRRLRLALRARAGRRTRLRALLAPRSAIRAVWALTDRATTVRVRTAERWASLVRRPKPSPSGQRGG